MTTGLALGVTGVDVRQHASSRGADPLAGTGGNWRRQRSGVSVALDLLPSPHRLADSRLISARFG
jgi:hypothetical protein